jgi:hypothetical protein
MGSQIKNGPGEGPFLFALLLLDLAIRRHCWQLEFFKQSESCDRWLQFVQFQGKTGGPFRRPNR